jgi:biotin carboxylase
MTAMPRILLLIPTTTYRTPAFVRAVRRLGVDVTVASEEPSTMAELNPTGLLTLDFADRDAATRRAIEFARRHPFDAVVPVDDQVTVLAAVIARSLGLRHNSVESAESARNKHRMRELLDRGGVPQPAFRLRAFADDGRRAAAGLGFPCVVKPLALSASRGVIRADDPDELAGAVRRLANIVAADAAAIERPTCHDARPADAIGAGVHDDAQATHGYLIEEFVAGPEFALEGLLSDGQLRVLALFDKPDPLDGPYFEETIYVTPSRLPRDLQESIAACAQQACRALGLAHGPIHAELRLRSVPGAARPTPYVIELNARSIGGLCSLALRFGTGLSLEELILRHALDSRFVPPLREPQPAGVMMIPIPRGGTLEAVRGLDDAAAVPGIEQIDITARPGSELVPLPEGGRYLGFIFAHGPSPATVESALRAAHACIEFDIRGANYESLHRAERRLSSKDPVLG